MSMLEEHPHLIRLKQVLYAPQRLYLITGGCVLSRQTCSHPDLTTGPQPALLMHCVFVCHILAPFFELRAAGCVAVYTSGSRRLPLCWDWPMWPGLIIAAFASLITWEVRALTGGVVGRVTSLSMGFLCSVLDTSAHMC